MLCRRCIPLTLQERSREFWEPSGSCRREGPGKTTHSFSTPVPLSYACSAQPILPSFLLSCCFPAGNMYNPVVEMGTGSPDSGCREGSAGTISSKQAIPGVWSNKGSGGTHDETPYRMKWCIRCVTYFFAAASFIPSRSVFASGYQDVAVVVNTNSQVSLDIGNYFQTARGIPQTNIIRVNTTTDETVNDSVFASLRHQIESYLRTNNLVVGVRRERTHVRPGPRQRADWQRRRVSLALFRSDGAFLAQSIRDLPDHEA